MSQTITRNYLCDPHHLPITAEVAQEGIVLALNKPLSWTSFNLVSKVKFSMRHRLGVKKLKVGHAGTLDPLASGVMLLAIGKATKQIEELQAGMKEYVCTMQLGATTPSYDAELGIDATFPFDHITKEMISEALPQFTGNISQIPPIYSACKIDGKKAYDMARKGKDVVLSAKTINIENIELLEYLPPHLTLRVKCGKGTYIRALARDLGNALCSGAYLTALTRTQIGNTTIDECLTISELEQWINSNFN